MKEINALIISGYGINCEKEMALACEMAGATATISHSEAILTNQLSLEKYDLIAFPGGFSFGDELGAAKAFANRLSHSSKIEGSNIKEKLQHHVNQGKCIIGICNGFQLLVKLGLLPGSGDNANQTVSLAHNESCQFESRWVHHNVRSSPCIFTKGISSLYLPVRHGEGKLVANDKKTLENLFENNHIVLQYADDSGDITMQYPHNPNGSQQSIGGMCDSTGRIFGMMAHPEGALLFTNTPQWLRQKESLKREKKPLPTHGPGYQIFKNAVDYLKESK